MEPKKRRPWLSCLYVILLLFLFAVVTTALSDVLVGFFFEP